MLSGRGTSALSLLVLATTVASAVACRSKTTEALDGSTGASAESGATTADDGSTAAADGGAIAPDAAGAFADSPSSTASLPLPTPFTGNYRCFKNGLHLEQTGPIVMATMHKDSTTDTIIACTAIGETCKGTVRDIHLVKTKGVKKVDDVRPLTLLRTKGGDVIVRLGHEQKPAGAKSTSTSSAKPAPVDETFCPRR